MKDRDALLNLLQLPREARETPIVFSTIRQLIARDDEALRLYIRWAAFEASLSRAFSGDPSERSQIVSAVRRQRNQAFGQWIGLMLTLLLISVTGFYLWSRGSFPKEAGVPIAAQLDTPEQILWGGKEPEQLGIVRPGTRLNALTGRFLLRLDSGAVAACTAPVDLEVVDGWELFVHRGDVCVQVPQQARGFRVNTEAVKVVDLGTLFGVRVDDEGRAEVHVLEGRVQSTTRFGSQDLTTGFAQKVDNSGRPEKIIPAVGEMFSTQLSSLAGIAPGTDSIRILPHPVSPVRIEDLNQEGTIHLLMERAQITLDTTLEIASSLPGTYDAQHLPKLTKIPKDALVSTCLIMGGKTSSAPLGGTITFDRPILGIALSSSQLDMTDRRYGHRLVQYLNPEGVKQSSLSRVFFTEGTAAATTANRFTIHPDGRTLTVHIDSASGEFPQLRVFIAARHEGP